jgi:hypothetical protein
MIAAPGSARSLGLFYLAEAFPGAAFPRRDADFPAEEIRSGFASRLAYLGVPWRLAPHGPARKHRAANAQTESDNLSKPFLNAIG